MTQASGPLRPYFIEDLAGEGVAGAWLWASHRGAQAVPLLHRSGVTAASRPSEMQAADPKAFAELAEACVLLGDEEVIGWLEADFLLPEVRSRIAEVARTAARLLVQHHANEATVTVQRLTALPPRRLRRVAIEIAKEVESILAFHGDKDRLIDETRLWMDRRVIGPMMEIGAIAIDRLFDRVYLPLRIQRGARFDHATRGITGGPSAFELDDEFAERGRRAPVYNPVTLQPRPLEALIRHGHAFERNPLLSFTKRALEVAMYVEGSA